MSINNLGYASCVLGGITTLYGAYSYSKGKCRNHPERQSAVKQREWAMLTMAAGVGLVAIGLGLAFYAPERNLVISETLATIDENLKKQLEPYLQHLEGRVVPQADGPIKTFPPYLSHFPHPGVVATQEGFVCTIHQTLPPLKNCTDMTSVMMVYLKKHNPPELLKGFTSPGSVWGKGLHFPLPVEYFGFSHYSFGMKPTIVSNFGAALREAEKTFLKDPDFPIKYSDHAVVDAIKRIHAIAANNLERIEGGLIGAGEFRTKGMFVRDDETEMTYEGLKSFLETHGGTSEDFKNLDTFVNEEALHGVDFVWKNLSPAVFKTLSKIGYIPPNAEKLEGLMLEFASQFKKVSFLVKNRLFPPIPGGAYIHDRLAQIHPFGDLNGRLSRILKYVVMQLGGIKAIVLPDDAAYTAAMVQNHKIPGSSVKFFLEVLDWNNRQKVLAP